MSYGLEIYEHIELLDGDNDTLDNIVLISLVRILALATELPLFWFLFQFLRKFAEIRRERGGLTSRRSNIVQITLYSLLTINALNTIAYNAA